MMGQQDAEGMAEAAGGVTPARPTGRSRSYTGGRRSPKAQRKSKADAADTDGSGQSITDFKDPASYTGGLFGSAPRIPEYKDVYSWAAKRDKAAREAESEIAALQVKVAKLEAREAALQRNQVSLAEDRGQLTAEKTAFADEKKELALREEALKREHVEKMAQLEQWHKESLDALESKNAALQAEVKHLTGEAAGKQGGLAAEVEHKATELQKLEYALAALKAENADLQDAKVQAIEAAREEESAKAAERIAELEAKLAAAEASDTASAEVAAKNAALEARLEAMVAALEKAEGDKARAEAKADAASDANAEAFTAALANAFGAGANASGGFAMPGQKPVASSIKITHKSDEFDPNTTIQVKRMSSKMKLTMGGTGDGFKALTDVAVSSDLETGKFKAGKFTIKVNNGTKASVELVAGDSLEKVIEKINRGVGDNALPLTVESKASDGKQFIVIKANEIGGEYHFEVYPEEDGVLQNIDRQVLPGPNKVCIYSNALAINDDGAIEPEGFDASKKWHDHFGGRIDFTRPQTLRVNGKDILRNISPEGNANSIYRKSTEGSLELIGELIKTNIGEGCKTEIKKIVGNKVYLEIAYTGPIDIDFPENSMLQGNMVHFGPPDNMAIVSINWVDHKGFSFNHDGIGEFVPIGVDSKPWIAREDPGHIEYDAALLGAAAPA